MEMRARRRNCLPTIVLAYESTLQQLYHLTYINNGRM